MLNSLGSCDVRIRSLVSMALTPTCVSVQSHQVLDEDDWILPSGRGIVLGDAAHPSPPGQIQSSAMSFEDAAVLAKLFSHLRRNDQIPSLLRAFVSLRAARANEVLKFEAANIQFMTMPYSEPVAKARDEGMRDMTRRGKNVFGGEDDLASAQGGGDLWETVCSTWTYGKLSFILFARDVDTNVICRCRRRSRQLVGGMGCPWRTSPGISTSVGRRLRRFNHQRAG
jgi:salicylate hydroxylase